VIDFSPLLQRYTHVLFMPLVLSLASMHISATATTAKLASSKPQNNFIRFMFTPLLSPVTPDALPAIVPGWRGRAPDPLSRR
jgi:hypothetical protein